ncbi:thioredoxin family protein [Calditerrivibrio nitroreducens]|uniref:Redox-active disulfide protein 2 n=1 Tax=Calditerrivibrio nitroreducens (strain DSM 19672 / NBRC 101217 / Yu37-1) TaxID=768670 RepID=E4TJ54_CALNY|nr:thioredoxin family protein [Calditerrivibrio nitroreducens]ADR18090.1 redox-active disulfide protein 2 [Calditerrivibrio nitroreducens DSM 19672]
MNIKILGTGCRNCEILYKTVCEAVEQLQLTDVTIEYVKEINEIIKYVMTTPGLVIDEVLVHEGKPLPNVEQVKNIILQMKK